MSVPLVELAGVVKRYDDAGVDAPEILRGVDLIVNEGETVAIVGPSGSGKSTLLNVIGALVPATAGEVRIGGTDLGGLCSGGLAGMRNREIGYIFQNHHLLPQCTALENVLVPSLVRDRKARQGTVERARGLLDQVGLADRTHHRPAQLSGGECQRVAVVRALINWPRLVLADEPTGSLDARNAEQLADLLCELNERESTTLITVTHSRQLAERMQRVLEMRDGVLAAGAVPA